MLAALSVRHASASSPRQAQNYRKILTAPKTARTIKPEAKARDAYEEHYARYTKIYPAIKEIYR